MFSAIAANFCGATVVGNKEQRKALKANPRAPHIIALVADIFVAIGFIALFIAAGKANIGVGTELKHVFLGIGGCYALFTALTAATHAKAAWCLNSMLMKPEFVDV